MGDISEHFNRSEFACHCGCGGDTIDAETLAIVERVRAHFGAPVVINSGYRCNTHNAAIGGAKASQHLLGRAADIAVHGVAPSEVYAWLDADHEGGLGSYNSFTHVDSRDGRARWSG